MQILQKKKKVYRRLNKDGNLNSQRQKILLVKLQKIQSQAIILKIIQVPIKKLLIFQMKIKIIVIQILIKVSMTKKMKKTIIITKMIIIII